MRTKSVLLRGGWAMVIVLVLAGLFALTVRTILLTADVLNPADVPDESVDPFRLKYYEHAWATYLHLGSGFLMMLLGPLQFVAGIRRRWIRLHRASGRILVVAAVIAGLSGLFIGVAAPLPADDGGFAESTAVIFITVALLFSLAKAVIHVRRREITQHREWMIRMFAVALSPAAERLMLVPLMIAGYRIQTVFGATFWMAIAVNLVAAEVWVHLRGPTIPKVRVEPRRAGVSDEVAVG